MAFRCMLAPLERASMRAPASMRVTSRLASSSTPSGAEREVLPAHLQTKRADFLFNFDKASGQREALHFTSYALAFGVPAALLIGPPVSTVVDLAMGVVVPLHSHLGMRSVIVDYVHDVSMQRIALLVLAVTTAGMAVGLTMFNLTDVGLAGAIKGLWVRQDAGVLASKKVAAH